MELPKLKDIRRSLLHMDGVGCLGMTLGTQLHCHRLATHVTLPHLLHGVLLLVLSLRHLLLQNGAASDGQEEVDGAAVSGLQGEGQVMGHVRLEGTDVDGRAGMRRVEWEGGRREGGWRGREGE